MAGKNHNCIICGNYNGFFVWSSDRRFKRHKLADICKELPKRTEHILFNEDYAVCIGCVRKHGLM